MPKSTSPGFTRRRFLADCGKMTGIGAMSSLLSLKMTNKLFAARAAGSITDYKGLVCIFLFGGNDSYNMLLPGNADYQNYLDIRGVLGIPENLALPITDGSLDYHLNPEITNIQSMYDAGELGFIANVGTLVQPTTMATLDDVRLPYGRFSHNDQIEQWQVSFSTSKTSSVSGTGWAGRILDILNDGANNNATGSVSLAPYGANTTQIGRSAAPFLTNGGVDALDLYGSDALVTEGMDITLEAQYASVMQAHHNHIRNEAMEQSALFEQIEQNVVIPNAADFPGSSIGIQLLQVAKYIKAQGSGTIDGVQGLNANRQTFFVGQTRFDSHGGGIAYHNNLMATLDPAIAAFNQALKDIGYYDKVVSYTASDFGRSLTPNSAGSDHGWGGNQMVFGGPVNGGKVYGTYPEIALNNATDVGRGRQLPTTSVDELHASLAHWYGVNNDNEMEQVIPNIRNFWDTNQTGYPIPNLFSS